MTEKLWLESIAQSVETMNNIGYIFAGVQARDRQPGQRVTMILEVLRSKLPNLDKKAMEGYLDRALSELSRVGYLLGRSRPTTCTSGLICSSSACGGSWSSSFRWCGEDFRDRGITIISAQSSPTRKSCQADPRALQQVLLNFLTNAADALQGRRTRPSRYGSSGRTA